MNIYSPSLKYYVYAYINEENGKPYYIGKGCGLRAYKPHRKIPVPKNKSSILFLERCLTEIGAYALERRYIRWYGKAYDKTGILLNISDGGDGCDSTHWNNPNFIMNGAEYKKELSEKMKNVWKNPNSIFNSKIRNDKITQTLKNKWKDSNSAYNRDNNRQKRQEHLNNILGKKFIIIAPDGTEHEIVGVKSFCRKHNLSPQSINRVLNGIWKQYKGWSIKEEKNEKLLG